MTTPIARLSYIAPIAIPMTKPIEIHIHMRCDSRLSISAAPARPLVAHA